VRILDGVPQQFNEMTGDATGISSITRVQESTNGALFRVDFSEPFIATVLARYGVRLQSIRGKAEGLATIQVTTPRTIPVHRTVEIVSLEYPEATLLETEAVDEFHGPPAPLFEQLLDRLTEQQRNALELAYHGGYFDSPKGLTGEELADRLGISSSSFHNHLRAAERELFDALVGPSSRDGVSSPP
jgi:predicted DNA binding protein